MLLPNGTRAIVDIRKLRDYCLSADNPRGSGKARVFARVLGLTARDAAKLRERLLEVAASKDIEIGELDIYGQRYTIELRSGWIALRGESAPRLTTCYVKKRKR